LSIQAYIEKISSKYATGDATEHSYRSALETLLESAAPDLVALNEPRRVACGGPDFIISRNKVPVGHCEAKDLHIDLTKLKDANIDQKKRYLKALPNLIYTNGLDFEFYKDEVLVRKISIGTLAGGKIKPLPDTFETLTNQLAAFAAEKPQTITSSKKLAKMMAGKAALIKDIMGNALIEDANLTTELTGQYEAFKTHLIHDIAATDFADIYAETIAYGMFAARLHDKTPDTFSRVEALELLPKSNPFLRSLFGYIAGVDLDDRIKWVIDELADVFQACDLFELLKDFGKFTALNDPFIHFYETFLAEYNPAKRKARGVWYTPEPVVNFIVRAVDDVLKTEFGLPLGLADTSKITIPWETGQTDAKGKRQIIKKQVHRVQILDPATGTGTFLAEVIKQIAVQIKGVAEGMWSTYVEQDLIPRLHGFELLMASYAMCHMKLDMMLTEMGYKPTAKPPRLGVYLTNSLEEGEVVTQNLFAQWLANEAKSASEIKRQMPIMCVIGNPPYNKSTMNHGTWITKLVECYKDNLDEKSINSLSQDEIKFIRYAEHYVEKIGYGIVGMVVNNSFLDGVTHRIMRKHLLSTFDSIHIINLHGDTNKGEQSPDNKPDKNIFDIKQGVTVILFVKTDKKKNNECSVIYRSMYGSRKSKYDRLFSERLTEGSLILKPSDPYHFFIPKDLTGIYKYEAGFEINTLFAKFGTGIKFRKDNLLVRNHYNSKSVTELISDMISLDEYKLKQKYNFSETPDWIISKKRILFHANDTESVIPVMYRPFDTRFTYYPKDRVSKLIPRGDSRKNLMVHSLRGINFALLSGRQNKSSSISHFFVTSLMSEMKTAEKTIQSTHFPLYLYPEEDSLKSKRQVNFDPKLYANICTKAGLIGIDGDELKVFDYIYGVLHSPDYRKTYAAFLKIDFPRIPYPASPEVFIHIADKGEQLRRLHLMESAAIGATPYPFKGEGTGEVVKPTYTDEGKVYINSQQWFEGVSSIAWEFHVGGYQPAQKWLKDRKGRVLSFDDVRHYQKIIKILSETDRIMKEIKLPLDVS
jgi:type I restriction-modification system DNA methylase subunit